MSHLRFSSGCGFPAERWEFHGLIMVLVEVQVQPGPSGQLRPSACRLRPRVPGPRCGGDKLALKSVRLLCVCLMRIGLSSPGLWLDLAGSGHLALVTQA